MGPKGRKARVFFFFFSPSHEERKDMLPVLGVDLLPHLLPCTLQMASRFIMDIVPRRFREPRQERGTLHVPLATG